ncbi:hypothetical protein JEZ13_00425 [bacterium]|nr:hypothetical protein [bacterium]
MAKKRKEVSKAGKPVTGDVNDNLIKKNWIGITIIVLFLSIAFFKLGFLGYEPTAHDTNQWRYTANESLEYNKHHSDPALWNSNIFSGMPNYLISFPTKYPFVKNLILAINPLINWKLSFLILGALGAFFLLRYLKMGVLTSTFLGLAFAISSHFVALIEMGHNTKFQVIMILPWLLYAIIYLREKRNLLGLGFFAVALITQLRLNHLQITYYLFLFLGIFWVYELVLAIKNKEYKSFWIFTLLLVIGLGIASLAVMNPHLSNWEYSHYSMRGGETGLTKEYAHGWSFHPLEITSLVFPNFFGGISPDYWGWMSFTQAYHYSGVIILLLGIIALFLSKKRYTKVFGVGILAALIMSFGKYFPLFSNFLHDYFPGFNKFRVPATHLVIAQLLLIPLAAIGLTEILKRVNNEKFAKIMRISMIVVVTLFLFNLVGGKDLFSGMNFSSQGEMAQWQQYQGNPQLQDHIDNLKAERLTLTVNSVRNGLFFLALGFGLIFFYTKQMLSKNIFLILIGVFIISDLMLVNGRYFQTLYPKKESKELAMNSIESHLNAIEAKGTYRVWPYDNMDDVSWSAHLQIIGGYHGAKLLRYNDVINKAMNINVINMLNAKYLISKEKLGQPLKTMKKGNETIGLYFNPDALDRAWFVQDLQVLKTTEERLNYLKSNKFRPRYQAIVESEIAFQDQLGMGSIEQVPQADFMHRIEFKVHNLDKDGFMVVSETYYPAGWKAYVDGVETEIYPSNHILRGIKVPAATEKVEMVFAPESYYLSTKLSLVGLVLSILLLLAGIYLEVFRKRQELA